MKTTFFLILVAVVLMPLSANAAGPASIKEKFKMMDTNQDGYISQVEAKTHLRLMKDWSAADANKDGKLEASEFSAFEEQMMQNRLGEKNRLQNQMQEKNMMQHDMQQKNMQQKNMSK